MDLLQLQAIEYRVGSQPLLRAADLAAAPGQRVCLVGRNGSGKSTLLKIAAGLLPAEGGVRFLQPGATSRYLPQEPDLSAFDTVLDYVLAGLGPSDPAHRARSLLDRLGMTGHEHPATLSGGEARRAALARTLAPNPDILLLDEPTNHLDLPAIEWLEAELLASRAAIVLISHDRRLLTRLGQAVVWLEDGRTRRLDKGFEAFEAWRDDTLEQQERDQHKLARQLAREEDWLRYGVTARRKRNVKRLADLHTLRDRRREDRRIDPTLKLDAVAAKNSGKQVIRAEAVSKSLGGRPIVSNLDLTIQRGDRLGIVGPNGAGKTTLLRLLTGDLAPDQGRVLLGAALQLVTLDQTRDSLDPTATLADTLTGGSGDTVQVGEERRHVIGYLKDFLFRPEQARSPVGVLSGGERGRLMLARAFARPANLLVLDEPTNDLDLDTLDLLQERLGEHPGTIILVSHDRDFLDRVATSILVAEGDGAWLEYAGGYSDMLAQRGTAPAARTVASKTAAPRAPAQTAPAQTAPPRPAPTKKLAYKDRHALQTLPARIAALTAEIDTLRAQLADPDLYSSNPARFTKITSQLAERDHELASAEEDWLRLEMLREEVESS